MPRKQDIRRVDRIVKEFGLSREQRRLLHEEIQRERLGEDLEEQELRELARQISELYPNK